MRGLVLALLLWPTVLVAVEPGEMLADPAQEARAQAIGEGLRCPVCRNESIEGSHAEVAADIRRMVRDRIAAGATDEAVVAEVVARYGEFILLNPTARGANLILWLAGPAMLLAGGGLAWGAVRRRSRVAPAPLSPEEEARLASLLAE